MNNLETKKNCMFCNRSKEEVSKLFTGKNANICDECVKVAFTLKDDINTTYSIKHFLFRKDDENENRE